MRLSTITNWAYAVTLILTALSAGAFILSARSADQERLAVEEHLELDSLAEDLALFAEDRTDEARLYVMRGDERHLARFHVDESDERRLEALIDRIAQLGATPREVALLETIRTDADALDTIEEAAIASYRAGNRAEAQTSLFSDEHDSLHMKLMESAREFREGVTARSQAVVEHAKANSDFYGLIARAMLTLTAALFLAVLYFVLRRRVAIPLSRMSGVVTRLARQDYSVEVPEDARRDEIGEMNKAIQIFRDNGLERDRLDSERRRDQQTKDLILQMMHRMQACQNQAELADVVSRFLPQIFTGMPGHLFVLNESRSALALGGSWLEPASTRTAFSIDDCWGLRRGRPHVSQQGGEDVVCQHLTRMDKDALCVPLTALGDTVGLLYFELAGKGENALETGRLYLELIAENIGLAVANLQLRERLTGLAKRDALTALLNRRSLDEALNHHRETPSQPLVCMMIDIDHFKHFNDRFGHDAGDAVMQYVARILLELVPEPGQVFRFGGEEFTVLIPDTGETEGRDVAERLRAAIEHAPLSHHGRLLDPITISVGIAASPAGGPVSSMLDRADAALLLAKQTGRNRVVSSPLLAS